ncbi:hypothetical protein Tco_0879727, partial [Tanacetum coccineum]
VMAAPVIPISSDSSEESVGSHAPELPLVSPFLCFDDLEADSESETAKQRPERHESLTPSSEFPLAHVVAPLGIRRLPAIRVRPDLHGDAYLIVLRIIILHRILLQTHLLLVHLQILHQIFLQVHLQIHHQFILQDVMHQAFMRWKSAPLSTLYPPTTSESSLDSSSRRSLDSSSPSTRPSCKRCRSPTTLVPLSTPISRSIAPDLADLPPQKRFRD